jgi:HAD superfamily hydrolase (TIGR01509 family)
MRFSLVIFDCDGVLVDSEPIANRVLCGLVQQIGLDIDYAGTTARYKGHSLSACIDAIEAELGAPVPGDFAGRYHAEVERAFRAELEPVPGVADAIDRLGRPVCVASSSGPEKLRMTLDVAGLLPRFEGRISSAEEVARGKPAPDVFLLAARRADTDPGRCAVIEDSPIGVEAALAAGMTPFGFAGTETADASALAAAGARVFADMRELPALITR